MKLLMLINSNFSVFSSSFLSVPMLVSPMIVHNRTRWKYMWATSNAQHTGNSKSTIPTHEHMSCGLVGFSPVFIVLRFHSFFCFFPISLFPHSYSDDSQSSCSSHLLFLLVAQYVTVCLALFCSVVFSLFVMQYFHFEMISWSLAKCVPCVVTCLVCVLSSYGRT